MDINSKGILADTDILIDYSLLSVRAVNALRDAGYVTLSECAKLDFEDLLKIKNIGKKTANEILVLTDSIRNQGLDKEFFLANKYEYWIKVLALPISKINLSVRTRHVLEKIKALSLLEIVQKRADDILKIRDCGRKTIKEIEDFLKQLDLYLGKSPEIKLIQDVKRYRSTKTDNEILDDFKNNYPNEYNNLKKNQISKLDPARMKFYNECFRAYLEGGTLKSVACKMKLTRERIRQILVKGTQLGLFNYTGRDYSFIEKNKIVEDYSRYLSLRLVAKANDITVNYLKQLLTAYKITDVDLQKIREVAGRKKCIE
jgi:DNA polymerase/3'-5' exonuclease PolX